MYTRLSLGNGSRSLSSHLDLLHLVDERNEAVAKADNIYKVIPLHDIQLPKFCKHSVPKKYIGVDEGMNPTKNQHQRYNPAAQ